MSVFYEAKIGYGYPVYGDDFPDYDCDDDASMDAYDTWHDQFCDSEFRHSVNLYWDCDAYFFGIMVDGVECGEFKKLSDIISTLYTNINEEEFDRCSEEYHRLFPNSKLEPGFYLMCVVW